MLKGSINATIHEHRAPTEESVRLLRELEKEAEAKVVRAMSIKTTDFHCVVQAEVSHFDDSITLLAHYRVGQRALSSQVTLPRLEVAKDRMAILNALVDAMAVKIATEILKPALMSQDWKEFK